MFLFLIKSEEKNPVLYNKSDDSIGQLRAKWLPITASVTVFLAQAGFGAHGDIAPQAATCPRAHF